MATNKNDLRAQLLSTKKPKSTEVELFESTIELRQPTLKQMMEMQKENNERNAIANILITQGYVPGTNERVFENTDYDSLMEWPVGEWLQHLTAAITELSGVDDKTAKNE